MENGFVQSDTLMYVEEEDCGSGTLSINEEWVKLKTPMTIGHSHALLSSAVQYVGNVETMIEKCI